MLKLIDQLKQKDEAAIAMLYQNYGQKLYGYAITKWKVSEDDAWELVYKTLYKVIDSIDNYTFEDENRFVGFLFQVFTNYLRNHIRDHKKDPVSVELVDHLLGPEEEGQQATTETPLMKCLKKVLATLDDWQRILLLMKAQDYAYADIAPYVDRPEKQLKVYNLRLRKTVSTKTSECVANKGYE